MKISQLLTYRISHPWIAMGIYLPLLIVLSYLNYHFNPLPFTTLLPLILFGILSWSFVEYILHRFVFHLTKIKEPWRNLASGPHMAHHREVDIPNLILASPLSSLSFGLPIYFIYSLICWSFSKGAWMEMGMMISYMVYEWMHYAAHCYQPKWTYFKNLKHYHLKHHFKYPNDCFGVTQTFWDKVFGTYK